MGKGDKKSRRGKTFKGSYGNTRFRARKKLKNKKRPSLILKADFFSKNGKAHTAQRKGLSKEMTEVNVKKSVPIQVPSEVELVAAKPSVMEVIAESPVKDSKPKGSAKEKKVAAKKENVKKVPAKKKEPEAAEKGKSAKPTISKKADKPKAKATKK